MSHISKDITGTLSEELDGKTIVHCVTSSISCFLAPQISRLLMRHGARVIPVLSPEAAKFVNPMIFEWATGEKPVIVIEGEVEHVKYAGLSKDKADLILVAPITANSISKIATGIMDTSVTLLTGTALGNNIPVIIVPTMHEVMMYNPAVKENLEKFKAMNVEILYPRIEEEKAKIPETEEIVEYCLRKLSDQSLKDKKVLVTAGPTRAFLDGVRFISNPSSGKMGYAVALEAWRRGAEVTLVYGSSQLEPSKVIEDSIKAETAKEMLDNSIDAIEKNQYDYIVLAAAMNDFVPEKKIEDKITSDEVLELTLKPAEKLADAIKQKSPESQLVLFKAEYKKTDLELIERAKERMVKAQADFIIANDVSTKETGFESDYNKVAMLDSKNETKWIEGTKIEIAKRIFDFILN
jgi:phosphopantothenoylcysteine decarboxylase/phosphopantothenate--cysteine ligase